MDKIHKARVALTIEQPFFGSLALRMELLNDPACATAYTDGRVIGYNPKFTDDLTADELKGLLAHEVMHVALAHHLRRGDREPNKWNMAGDYAINDILLESGFVLPSGGLSGMGTDKSADTLYQRFSHDVPDPPAWGEVRDFPGKSGSGATPSELARATQEVKVMVNQAATQAKAMGSLPGMLERLVEGITHPPLNWREVLRRFMARVSKNDYSWSPPNRRYVHQGLYLPSLLSTGIDGGIIAVDTSGSVRNHQVAQFAAEISAIVEAVDTTVIVIYCDTRVRKVETFGRYDLPIKIKPMGGGGTDFRPPFDWVENGGYSPAYLVYLSDLGGMRFPDEPGYPVLWAKLGKRGLNPPFGEVMALPWQMP